MVSSMLMDRASFHEVNDSMRESLGLKPADAKDPKNATVKHDGKKGPNAGNDSSKK